MILLHFVVIGIATLLGFLPRLQLRNALSGSNTLTLSPTIAPRVVDVQVPTLPYQTSDWVDVIDVHPSLNNLASSSFLVNSCRLRPIQQAIFLPLCPVLYEAPRITIHEEGVATTPQEQILLEDDFTSIEPEPAHPNRSWIPGRVDLYPIVLILAAILALKYISYLSSQNSGDVQVQIYTDRIKTLQEDVLIQRESARTAGEKVSHLESSNNNLELELRHLKFSIEQLKSTNEELNSRHNSVLESRVDLEKMYSRQSESGKKLQSELQHKESIIKRLQTLDKERVAGPTTDSHAQTDDQYVREELEAKQSELDAVQSDLITLQEEVAKVKESHQHVENHLARRSLSLEQAQKKLDDERANHKITRGKHQACVASLERESNSRRGLEQAKTNLTRELKQREDQLNVYKASAQKKERELEELQSNDETATLRKEIADLQTRLEASNKSKTSLLADFQRQKRQLKDKDDVLNKNSSELSALEHQNKTLEEKNKDAKLERGILSQKCTQLEKQITTLKSDKNEAVNLNSEKETLEGELREAQASLNRQIRVNSVQSAENKRVQKEVEELKKQRKSHTGEVETLNAQLQQKEADLQASQAACQRMIEPEVLGAEKERVTEYKAQLDGAIASNGQLKETNSRLEKLSTDYKSRISELEAENASAVASKEQLKETNSLLEQLHARFDNRISELEAENALLRQTAAASTTSNYDQVEQAESFSPEQSSFFAQESSSSPEGPTTAEPYVFETGSGFNEEDIRTNAERVRDLPDVPPNPESPTTAKSLSLDDDIIRVVAASVEAGDRRRSIKVNFPPTQDDAHVESSQSSLEPSGHPLESEAKSHVEEKDASVASPQQLGDDRTSSPLSEPTPTAISSSADESAVSTESISAPVEEPAPQRAGSEKEEEEEQDSNLSAPATAMSETAEPPKPSTEAQKPKAKGLESSRWAPAAVVSKPAETSTPSTEPKAPNTPKGLEASMWAPKVAPSESTEPPKASIESQAPKTPRGLEASMWARKEPQEEEESKEAKKPSAAAPVETPQVRNTPKGLEASIHAPRKEAQKEEPEEVKKATPKAPVDTPQASKPKTPKGLEASIFAPKTPEPSKPSTETPQDSKPKGLESSMWAPAAVSKATETPTPSAGPKVSGAKGLEASMHAPKELQGKGSKAENISTKPADAPQTPKTPRGLEASQFAPKEIREEYLQAKKAEDNSDKGSAKIPKGLEASIYAPKEAQEERSKAEKTSPKGLDTAQVKKTPKGLEASQFAPKEIREEYLQAKRLEDNLKKEAAISEDGSKTPKTPKGLEASQFAPKEIREQYLQAKKLEDDLEKTSVTIDDANKLPKTAKGLEASMHAPKKVQEEHLQSKKPEDDSEKGSPKTPKGLEASMWAPKEIQEKDSKGQTPQGTSEKTSTVSGVSKAPKGLEASQWARPLTQQETSQRKKAEDTSDKTPTTPGDVLQVTKTPKGPETSPLASVESTEDEGLVKKSTTSADTLLGSKKPKGLEASMFAPRPEPQAEDSQATPKTSTTPKGLEASMFARPQTQEDSPNPKATSSSSTTPQGDGHTRDPKEPKGLEASQFAPRPEPQAKDTPNPKTPKDPEGLEASMFAPPQTQAEDRKSKTSSTTPTPSGTGTNTSTRGSHRGSHSESTSRSQSRGRGRGSSFNGSVSAGTSRDTSASASASQSQSQGQSQSKSQNQNQNQNQGRGRGRGRGASTTSRAGHDQSRSQSRIPRRSEPSTSAPAAASASAPGRPPPSIDGPGLGDRPFEGGAPDTRPANPGADYHTWKPK
ncbi:hypothetical protein B0A52_05090 [Exophiala mesophila]|uniref:Uncharacterized protein n=1 Tax=Exophiala mesophila TaxID=212818 RepID=A0A438N6W9_EXOME|nr:hypothetical protein B0A52_05090 [Exophiala mesophila]